MVLYMGLGSGDELEQYGIHSSKDLVDLIACVGIIPRSTGLHILNFSIVQIQLVHIVVSYPHAHGMRHLPGRGPGEPFLRAKRRDRLPPVRTEKG